VRSHVTIRVNAKLTYAP